MVKISASLSGRGEIGMTARAIISASFAGTGRFVHADALYGAVQSWAHSPTREVLQAHTLASELNDAVAAMPLLIAEPLLAFRGRVHPFLNERPTREEMGPPLPTRTPGGRYNFDGSSVLYLCGSREGVRRELAHLDRSIWVQEFAIPTGAVRLVDLSISTPAAALVNAVLWFAELSGAPGYPSVLFSQFVASLVSQLFDGMVVPGVRGDEHSKYVNIIVFDPRERWSAWLSPEEPQPL